MSVSLAPTRRPASASGLSAELWLRRGLLLIAAAAALTAVLAGLARLGVVVGWGPSHAGSHGPLFVLGVFGTIISLERAVALARSWSFLAPTVGAAAGVAMLAGLWWAPWAASLSALALVLVNAAIVRRQAAAFTWLMLLGAAALLVGNLAWALGKPVSEVVPAWIAFFVLTITSERLELSRLTPTPVWASRALIVTAVVLALLAGGDVMLGGRSAPAFGGALALLAAWQLRFDIARRTLRQPGLARFAALGVLAGAAWLLVGGALFATPALASAGPLYDAALHAIFVGYVLSMVFAHAPIILPAVARVRLPYHWALLVPLAALHLGLLLRVLGDLVGHAALRQGGAIISALALAGFLAAVLFARVRASSAAAR